MCSGFTTDVATYGQSSQLMLDSSAKPTNAQVDTFLRSAVNNLCPTERDKLP